MMYDTDILIWIQRGNEKAARLIDKGPDKSLSIYSYMELLQGARNKTHHNYVKEFIYSNVKHFRAVKELQLKGFNPR